jgi:hypothetical protein
MLPFKYFKNQEKKIKILFGRQCNKMKIFFLKKKKMEQKIN